MVEKAIVGITMGDPAGIGPEIVVKAHLNPEIFRICKPVVIGDFRLLIDTMNKLNLHLKMRVIQSPKKALGNIGSIEVIDLRNVDPEIFKIGQCTEESGQASIDYIKVAVKYALNGDIDAITTAPINKEALLLAGSIHIDHTELISALSNTPNPITMFWVRGLPIFFLTRHLQLKKALEEVKMSKLFTLTHEVDNILRNMGFTEPRIAIPALNPHASDGGLMGDEEEKEIIPAITRLREDGINAIGPIPADAVFHQAFLGTYDAVITLYHDQGHIPAKTIDFHGTVAVTLGLPFVRSSVDHGTAFDIAGKGVANSKSLEEAIKVAVMIWSKFRS